MSRKVFDKLTSGGGVIVVVMLVVAGGLLTWGHSFVNSNVHNQLAQQQAQAYADHFIAIHLCEMPYGGVYSKISAAAIANPNSASLKTLKQTSFQGTTLRGLLLEAYAFSKIGQVMMWGAIASFMLALVMSVLVGLGLAHARQTEPEKQLLMGRVSPSRI